MQTNKRLTSSPSYRLIVFWIGIIATLAYRALLMIAQYGQRWVDITWYIGTIGFVWYFVHRYNVEKKRDQVIIERKLVEKIEGRGEMTKEDTEALATELKNLLSSKSRLNYIAIFIASGLALAYDIAFRIFIK